MQKDGITSDIDSLYERKGGKLDNGKYVVGRIPKKMPTLSDFQKKLQEREKCEDLAKILVPFLRGNSLGIFDCESQINSDAEIVNFDMSEIKDEFTKLYASFVSVLFFEVGIKPLCISASRAFAYPVNKPRVFQGA